VHQGRSRWDGWTLTTEQQRRTIEAAAQAVLDARAKFSKATLAEMYDPLAMPAELLKAHEKLDKAVDVAYGKSAFGTEAERVAFLFELYEKLVAPMDVHEPEKKGRRKTKG
jgi:acyl-CoA reductase-like NAD-dependent aldehyde dehydrogenase